MYPLLHFNDHHTDAPGGASPQLLSRFSILLLVGWLFAIGAGPGIPIDIGMTAYSAGAIGLLAFGVCMAGGWQQSGKVSEVFPAKAEEPSPRPVYCCGHLLHCSGTAVGLGMMVIAESSLSVQQKPRLGRPA